MTSKPKTLAIQILLAFTALALSAVPSTGAAENDVGVPAFAQIEVDPTPETTLKEKPGAKTTSSKATFSFTSNQPGSHFECKLDKKPFKSCRSPFKAKRLKRGRHVFRVRAINAGGVADPVPAVYRWRIL